MYRSYFLKQGFYAKKGDDKIFMKHDPFIGVIYAILQNRRVIIIVNGERNYFDNFDEIDSFLFHLEQDQNDFMKILRRRSMTKKLRMLEI